MTVQEIHKSIMRQRDITSHYEAEVVIRQDGKTIWINVDGVCVERILLAPTAKLILIDARK